MLLITGPTGNVGDELTTLLAEHAGEQPWRVASRHPDKLRERLAATTAEVARLDFFDPATWPAVLKGVKTLFLLFPLPGNKAAKRAIIPFLETAEAAGCEHVVYVSVFGADRAKFIPHHKTEQALFNSGMSHTVLRCSFFDQNLHRNISTHGTDIAEHHELFVPAGKGLTTFVDARDCAAVAMDAVLNPDRHRNVVHHLTGPERLSMEQVAEQLSEALGEKIRYTNPSLPRFAARLRRRGVGWDTVGFMSAVYTLTKLNQNQPITDEIEQLLGRPPRTLREYLEQNAWRWPEHAWT
jgi:uncharacterized protein YbjT (DUF2867 family)